MIDYEITVSVNNLTEDEKKRVQDAFFKLGFTWRVGVKYTCLDVGCYTNTFDTGKVTQDLMWAGVSTKPTHTVDELLELADMADTKRFDLEKALSGELVVLRDGTKAYVRHYETELDTGQPLIGYMVDGAMVGTLEWTEDGHFFSRKVESEYDIVGMWVEPLVFEHWDLLAESVKYIAKDEDGRWFGYSSKPERGYANWRYDGTIESMSVLNPSLTPNCGWKDSLIERPEND